RTDAIAGGNGVASEPHAAIGPRGGVMPVTVAAVRETAPNEKRVALTPEIAKKLKGLGANVVIQAGAGGPTHVPDASFGDFVEKVPDAHTALGRADILFKVAPPSLEEIAAMREGSIYIGYLQAHANPERTRALRDRKI